MNDQRTKDEKRAELRRRGERAKAWLREQTNGELTVSGLFRESGVPADLLAEIIGLLDTQSEIERLRFFLMPDVDLCSLSPQQAMQRGYRLDIVRRRAKQFGHQVAR